MATADQYETAVAAVATAAQTLAGYGSTGGVSGQASLVTATSTKKHRVSVFSSSAVLELFRELIQGGIGIHPATPVSMQGDSAVLVADTPTETFVVARIKK